MATKRYIGMEPKVAQVDTFTPGGTIEGGDLFMLTVTALNGSTHEVKVAAPDTTAAALCAALIAAWNDDQTDFCTPITASGTNTVILTADAAGVAFSVVFTTTEANGDAADDQTVDKASTTANAGPANYADTGNWSGGSLPGAGDDTYIEGADPILYGLDRSGDGTMASLHITESRIGTNPADGFDPTYLEIRASVVDVNYKNGLAAVTQQAPVMLDMGAVETAMTIHDTGRGSSIGNTGEAGVRILANNAASTILVRKGVVAVAPGAGETTTVGEIVAGSADSDVLIGDGVTLTTLMQHGGDVVMRSGSTTATIENGTLRTEGDGAIGTLNVNGGVCTSNSTGTITAANVTGKGMLDLTKSDTPRTVTTPKIAAGAKMKLDPGVITITNKIQLYETSGELQISVARV